MTETSHANWDMTIILPLGVVASQLMKIETHLRLLNMKAMDFAQEREPGRISGLIGARLEHINEALDSIRGLVSAIQADIQPSNLKRQPDRDD